MIVCKFGGSSLADAAQIKKACKIMLADPKRRIMVASAAGIRPDIVGDRKMTDLLIALAQASWAGLEGNLELLAIRERLYDMAKNLEIGTTIVDQALAKLNELIANTTIHHKIYHDSIVAMGEEISARMVAAYLQKIGVKAAFVDPCEIGLLLSYRKGSTEILPQSYPNLAVLKTREEIIVFPGFYGCTEDGDVITFSRGGSDITGAILAAATHAELYENFTDTDYVYAVSPKYIRNARPLAEISYREMRELSYNGFSIIHHDAIEPLYSRSIPIRICNTNNPAARGTLIVAERTHIENPVTGISCAEQFCAITISKILINGEIGVLAEILTIFAEQKINVEHVPTGIDSVTLIVRDENFTLEIEQEVTDRLKQELGFDKVEVTRNLAAVTIVGEGMYNSVGIIARAAVAIAEEHISIDVVLSDYREISCLFLVEKREAFRAVNALYREFFSVETSDTLLN